METTEIIIRDNGTLTERFIRERDLDAGQAVLDALTEQMTRPIRNVLSLPNWGLVHASIGVTDIVWTVSIDHIPLHTRFRLSNDVLVPVFASTADPELPLVWSAPSNVHLAFVIVTSFTDECVCIEGNWLFACDQNHRGYRLPLPNLYDDCKLCTGSFNGRHDSGGACVIASLEQFRKSKWNSDLMPTVESSQKFFRFRPTNETFETLPIESDDWTTLCDKVSTDILERVIL